MGLNTNNNTIDDKWHLGSSSDDIIGALWDGGGVDTLDISGFLGGSKIDLREEAFSSFGGLTNNFSIARGVVIENAIGGRGDDTITGNEADNNLRGERGNDELNGGLGNDILDGGAGNDDIFGGSGADILIGNAGADDLKGQGGTDWAYFNLSTQGVTINLVTGMGRGGDAQGDTFTNIENIMGSNVADAFYGDAANNVIMGNGGSDFFNLGVGNDRAEGGQGNDVMFGLGGSDFLLGGDGNDVAHGNTGNDLLTGNDGNDRLYGGANNDFIAGGADDDQLFGSIGVDRLLGGTGDNAITGGPNGDQLTGGAGSDDFRMLGFFGDNDVIKDFTQGVDSITLSVAGVDNYMDVLSAMTNVQGNTMIDFGTNQSFLIEGLRPAELTSGDFIIL